MNKFKRFLAAALALVLLFTACPQTAFAAGEQTQTALNTGNVTVEGTNAFGRMLSNDIMATQTETESEYEAGYVVTNLEIEGKRATIEYSSLEDAIVVVALYSEDGMQLLASGDALVRADEEVAYVTLEGEMPEYFLASAYLMDTYDLSPLCAAYDTPMYTREMQELLASTVEDYDPEKVLNLDDDNTTNFAVYADSTIIIEGGSGVNTVASIDDTNYVYVIENADESVKSLVKGDVFVYPYEENELLIAKVKSIKVSGNTVTITGDSVDMQEAFSHAKMDGDVGTEDAVVDDSTADEGITYTGMQESGPSSFATKPGTVKPNGEISRETTVGFEYNIFEKGVFEFKGNLQIKTKVSFEYYITKSYQRVELKIDFGGKIGLEAEMSGYLLDKEVKLGNLKFVVLPGVTVEFTPSFVIKLGLTLEGSLEFETTLGFGFEHDDKGWKFLNLCTTPKATLDLELEGKIFVGFKLTPSVEVLEGVLADAEVSGQIGFEVSGKMLDKSTGDSKEERHECTGCLDCNLAFKLKVTPSLQFLKSEKLKYSTNLVNTTWKLFDFYLCIQHMEGGLGKCPRYSYLITFEVKDKDGNPVANKEIRVSSLEAPLVTNENGIAEAFVPAGSCSASVAFGDSTVSRQIYADGAQKVRITQTTPRPGSGSGGNQGSGYWDDIDFDSLFSLEVRREITDHGKMIASGLCGPQLNWELYEDGFLYIYGQGEMYEESWQCDVFWPYQEVITSVEIESGCTRIANYAFYNCKLLTSVLIPNSVKEIASYAFAQTGLKSVTIPGSVKKICCYAFEYNEYLETVIIEDGCRTIEYDAFLECPALSKLRVPGTVTEMGNVFGGDNGLTSAGPLGSGCDYEFGWTTTIPDYAFSYLGQLETATIPAGITKLGEYAFSSCSILREVLLPDGLTTMGEGAFAYCEALEIVNIPATVTALPNYAFYNCTSLTGITIPNSAKEIGSYALSCTGLESVTVPGSVRKICSYAFEYNDYLETVVIEDGCQSIEHGVFSDCPELRKVRIPGTVTTMACGVFDEYTPLISAGPIGSGCELEFGWTTKIPDEAFSQLSNLETAIVPSGIVALGKYTFENCYALRDVSLPNGLSTLGEYAFYCCESLEAVNIPATVTAIPNYAFYGCTSLTGIAIPNSVKEIGSYAFGWTGLDSVTVPGSVKKICSYAFEYNDYLEKVIIEDGCQTIEYCAFQECPALSKLRVPGTVTSMDNGVFDENTGLTSAGPIGSGCDYEFGWTTTIPDYAFHNLGQLETATIPAGVTKLGEDAFLSCGMLREVSLPDGLTTVDEGAFAYCEALEIVNIPATVTAIPNYAFYDCTSLTGITIPNGATMIGSYAFSGAGLESVTVPGSVRKICSYAFEYNDYLETVIIEDGCQTIEYCAFLECPSLSKLQVPGTVTSMDNGVFDENTGLTSAGPIGSGCDYEFGWTTTIPDYAFSHLGQLETATIPAGVTKLGEDAFLSCGMLREVSLPDGLTTVDEGAFAYCEALEIVNIPATVTAIPNYAFYGCTSLTGITIPNGATMIGSYAFSGAGLESVTVPGSVITIGRYAFAYNEYLESVTIGAGCQTIEYDAFGGCTALTSIRFQGDAPLIYEYTFDDVEATAYYPRGNSTWSEAMLQDYGGTLTWVPYTVTNGNMVDDFEAAVTVVPDPAELELYQSQREKPAIEESVPEEPEEPLCPQEEEPEPTEPPAQEEATEPSAPDPGDEEDDLNFGGEDTDMRDAIYGGDYSTEYEDGKTVKTASFSGLVPGEQYVLIVLSSLDVRNPLAPGNMLYIDQGQAGQDGTLVFRYTQRFEKYPTYIAACGASGRNLKDAVITFPDMFADSGIQTVDPVVVYGDKTLEEGKDYVVSGTVSFSEAGEYTCYIRGIRQYSGFVTCPYTVQGGIYDQDTLYFGDVNQDGFLKASDAAILSRYIHEAGYEISYDMAEFLLRCDLVRDGVVDTQDGDCVSQLMVAADPEALQKQYEDAIESIEVLGVSKTEYISGERLNTDGISLKFNFADGVSYEITNGLRFSGFDTTHYGVQTITVRFFQFSAQFNVTVEHPDGIYGRDRMLFGDANRDGLVDFLDILLMNKLRLYEDEAKESGQYAGYPLEEFLLWSDLDRDGEILADTDIMMVNDLRLADSAGKAALQKQYEDAIVSIELRGIPKTEYLPGEALDTDGIAMVFSFADGISYEITEGLRFSGFDPELDGDQTVTVDFFQFSAQFTVTVEENAEPDPDPDPNPDPDAMRIVVDTVTATAGETVVVTVSIQNNPGFGGMAYDVCYDNTVLELVSYELGLGGSICVDSGPDTYSNKVSFQYAGTSNITGDGALVSFTFTVKDGAAEGLAEITVLPEAGTVFHYDGKTEVDLELTPVNGGIEIVEYVKGDANGDGKVNNRDAARILQYLAGWDVEYVEAAMDINGDGKVNNRDAARLMQYLAGWDVVIN